MRMNALVLLVVAGCAPKPGALARPAKCESGYRWAVKTGSDAGAAAIDRAAIRPVTIAEMLEWPATVGPESSRVAPVETTMRKLSGRVVFVGGPEKDGDYEVSLAEGDGIVIVEFPDPDCLPASSAWAKPIAAARARFEAERGQWAAFVRGEARRHPAKAEKGLPITVIGPGFLDHAKPEKGHADNGAEIHPVLAVCFGDGCTPEPPLSQ